ncbi:unnamed protein product [Schistocephalus solidus]|uniref:Uncharacterized protein n=1 Tax=Schistocephalus solidus TaxID=70667 RepID=A0A183T0N0_SCHSO|nr:unnamed protein product [Schistocephalus solidus]
MSGNQCRFMQIPAVSPGRPTAEVSITSDIGPHPTTTDAYPTVCSPTYPPPPSPPTHGALQALRSPPQNMP